MLSLKCSACGKDNLRFYQNVGMHFFEILFIGLIMVIVLSHRWWVAPDWKIIKQYYYSIFNYYSFIFVTVWYVYTKHLVDRVECSYRVLHHTQDFYPPPF